MKRRRAVRASACHEIGIVAQHVPDDIRLAKGGGREDVHLCAMIEQEADEIVFWRENCEMNGCPVCLPGDWLGGRPLREQPANDAAVTAADGVVQRSEVPFPVRSLAQGIQ
jgi:hypothetical protein